MVPTVLLCSLSMMAYGCSELCKMFSSDNCFDPDLKTNTGTFFVPKFEEKKSTFSVNVENSDGCIGLVLRKSAFSICVKNVKNVGKIAEWNREHKHCQVRVGDFLVSVNDKHDVEEMVNMCKALGSLELVFRRNAHYNAVLEKAEKSLALTPRKLETKDDVVVAAHANYRCQEWKEPPLSAQVRPGDIIVALNSVWEVSNLTEQVATADGLVMRLFREREESQFSFIA